MFDTCAELAYRGHEDGIMGQFERCQHKALDCHDRGDDIGATIYQSIGRAWLACRGRLAATPFGSYPGQGWG